MDVTRQNFIDALALVESLLPETAFACIDLEFTGLGNVRPSQLDTPSIRYATVRADAESFPPIQFGVALFRRKPTQPTSSSSGSDSPSGPTDADTEAPSSKNWQVTPFNFNVLPRASYYPHWTRYPIIDRIFKIQGSTVQFLGAHGFSFAKVIEDGISWQLPKPEQTLREHVTATLLKKRQLRTPSKKNDGGANKEEVKLREKWEQFITGWMTELKAADSTTPQDPHVRTFVLPKFPQQRRVVFEYIRKSHPLIVSSVMAGQQGSELKLQLYTTEEAATAKREELLTEEVEEEVSRSVGFRLVVDALRRAKVPIVVHNGLMDLVKLFANFVGPLPDTLSDFKTAFRQAFPVLYDTRWMLEQLCEEHKSIREIVNSERRGIGELHKVLEQEAESHMKDVSPIVTTFVPTGKVINLEKRIGTAFVEKDKNGSGFEVGKELTEDEENRDIYGFCRYSFGDGGQFEHEAGFDAVETGRFFLLLCLMRGVGKTLGAGVGKGLDALKGAQNQIYLGSCGGFRRIDLNSTGEGEENVYFGQGNAIVLSATEGRGQEFKEDGGRYWKYRDVLKKVTEGTFFDAQNSRYIRVGPTCMLTLLQKRDGGSDEEKSEDAGGKRSREGNGRFAENAAEVQKVVTIGERIGIGIVRYEDAAGKCDPRLKRRKFS